MILGFLRKNWPVLTIFLCAAMLALLAGLQFVWTGQLSEAQGAIMQNALENSMRQFEQEIGRELMYLLVLFQREGRGSAGDRWSRYAESFELWSHTSSHPDLLRRLLVHRVGPDGTRTLEELPLGAEQPVPVDWNEELSALRQSLEASPRLAGRDFRWPSWRLYPASRAMVRPLPPRQRPRRPPSRPQPDLSPGQLILVLDWTHASDTVLPELVQRFFAGTDGERLYDVAIAAGGGGEFLYRSDQSIGREWLASADIRRRMRLLRDGPGRGRGPGPPPDPAGRLPAGGGRPPGWSFLNLGRAPILVVGDSAPLELELAAAHVSGSLAGLVDSQRARNLATGLGVLLLLGGAMALVVVSTRRAAQLAGMKMEFIAGITHELRTPLSVICSVGENLADGVVGAGQQAQRYGELIRDQGRRLTEMVEQTLQFASMESRIRSFRLVTMDPSRVVETAIDRARPMIDQAGFSLELDEQPGLPSVRADEKAVQQILANLLSNAVKYGERGRWVRVATRQTGTGANHEVQISVADRGIGISAKEAGRLFDAFYRGEASAERNIQGSGLGLRLAHDLAVGMGCKLSFQSEPPQPTVFTLHLPAQPN